MARRVNKSFDSNPGLHHQYIFKLSKRYILNKVVLDVGCWTGQYTKLASAVAKKIYGLDPDKNAIKFAKKQVTNGNFLVGSAVKLPYPSEFFDVVVISEVLEHVPLQTEQKVLKEIRRVLKKGGILILSTPNNNIFSILLDPAYFMLGHRHYSKKKIIHFLNESHFKIKKIFTTKGIAHLLMSNIELLFKYLLDRKLFTPLWVNNLLIKEQTEKGFATICVIAEAA